MAIVEGKVESKWLSLIASGKKIIEGRVNKPPFNTCIVGDIIQFHDGNNNNIQRRIVDIKRYW